MGYCWRAWVGPSMKPPSGRGRSSPRPSRGLPSCWSSSGHGPLPYQSQTPRRQFRKLLYFLKRGEEEVKNINYLNLKWEKKIDLLAKEFLSLELRVKLTLCDMLEYGYVLVNVARHLCSVVLVLFFVLFFFLLISVTWNRVLWFFANFWLSLKSLCWKKKKNLA